MYRKLFYISPRDVRKNRADAVHIMLSCQSFAKKIEVELVTPLIVRDEYIVKKEEIFDIYGINEPNFKLHELKTKLKEVSGNDPSFISVVVEKLKAFLKFGIITRKELDKDTIIYSKCFISTVPLIFLKRIGIINSLIVFEVITPKNSWLHRFIFRNSDKIISHLKYVTNDIIEFAKVDKRKIFEPPYFTQSRELEQIQESKEDIRHRLGLKDSEKYILYAGKTGEKVKQVHYFIESAEKLPNLKFLIVGANPNSKIYFEKIITEKGINNVLIYPFIPLIDYYRFVLASDILIGFYPATKHNKYHLSPGKSGIYFSTKNPCIFSDLPSLRYLFPDEILFYAKPDDVNDLVAQIRYVLQNEELAKQKAKAAFEFASNSTYDRFSEKIIQFISID